MGRVSIAFVDDHPVLLDGLAHIFSELARFEVLAVGRCASDVVELATAKHPDVVLLDLNMPGDAFAAIVRTRELSPETKIVVFTASAGIDHAVRALEAGATGYVLKGSTDDELMQAIDTVLAGETFITPSFASKVIAALRAASIRRTAAQKVKLSVREEQIVRLLLLGRTNKEIAQRLQISEKTVKHYMTLLMQKLQARNRVEVVLAAQELGGYASDRSGARQAGDLLN
ncbi:MAG: DNA-binding response regulator [Hyphomicrobiales bacterium]|nr:MAG: DNA-binding response regulator [Hyphomicrobiales bacterium]